MDGLHLTSLAAPTYRTNLSTPPRAARRSLAWLAWLALIAGGVAAQHSEAFVLERRQRLDVWHVVHDWIEGCTVRFLGGLGKRMRSSSLICRPCRPACLCSQLHLLACADSVTDGAPARSVGAADGSAQQPDGANGYVTTLMLHELQQLGDETNATPRLQGTTHHSAGRQKTGRAAASA